MSGMDADTVGVAKPKTTWFLFLFLLNAHHYQGRIDPPKAGRGHATPIEHVQMANAGY